MFSVPVLVQVHSVIDTVPDNPLEVARREESRTQEHAMLLYDRAGHILLRYTERTEGGVVHCEAHADQESVRVRRHGAAECELVLRVGERHRGIYRVAPYEFDLCVCARRVENTLTPQGGKLLLVYDLTLGGVEKVVRMEWTLSPEKPG